MALLKTENLSFTYPNSNYKALDNISFEINSGEMVLIMGKTGSGKSTLLRLLKKEIAPYGKKEGNIITPDSIAYVSQNAENTFVSETVRGELAFALENQCVDNDEIAVRIGEVSSFFNLADSLDKTLDFLSGGEKTTVAVAAAMITNAKVLLLDEPFSQLDAKSCHQLSSLLKRVNDELGVTVVIVSHISDGIVDLCDRLIILEKGRIIANDIPKLVAKNNELLPFFPICTALFDSRPLTVKEAVLSEKHFKEKENIILANKDKPTVKLKDVTFAYEKNGKDILSRLNFNAYAGEIHFIIGSNGSGKTTMLKLIAGISKAYSGKVKAYGQPAYIPQNVRYLFTEDTVLQEIGEKQATIFNLNNYLDRHPYDLSGGELQKLALAKISMQSFDILLLDEPSKSLDAFAKKELIDYLVKLKELGKTIIIVSHDLDFAGDLADRISFLSDGIITISNSRREVLSRLSFYTSQVRRITGSYLNSAVSVEDLI